jgi:hypothetical protein
MAPESPFRILFRTWSSSSAGRNSRRGFRSGYKNRRNIGLLEMAEHFENHSNLDNRVPTCFISTTDDPVRALKYAIDLQGRDDDNIHISIIRSNNYLYGEELATLSGCGNEPLFKTEFLFLWEIEATEILHVVSLETLERSNLLIKFKVLDPVCWEEGTLPPLWRIREEIYNNNEKAWDGNSKTWPERSGRYVAAIAKCFGNGAPRRAIASLIWDRGTHFRPYDYEVGGLDLRVRDAIRRVLDKEGYSCWHDEWCGELASA